MVAYERWSLTRGGRKGRFDCININEIPNHCKRCDLLCNLSNGDLFTCEDKILFSNVKNDIMFLRESSPGI